MEGQALQGGRSGKGWILGADGGIHREKLKLLHQSEGGKADGLNLAGNLGIIRAHKV